MKSFQFSLIVLALLSFNSYGAAAAGAGAGAADRSLKPAPAFLGFIDPTLANQKSLITLDPSSSPDDRIEEKINEFKSNVKQYAGLLTGFGLDLSHTFLTNDGVKNLVALLSQKVDMPGGKRGRPLDNLTFLNLSYTAIGEEGLLSLIKVLKKPRFDWLYIYLARGAAHLESIRSLLVELQGKYPDEDTISRSWDIVDKVIWIPERDLASPSLRAPKRMIAAHRTFYAKKASYGIKGD